MRGSVLIVALLLAACSNAPAETNAAEADEHAQQALQQIAEMNDTLANIENEQNRIDADVKELSTVTENHVERLDTLETNTRQLQSDVDNVKSRLNM